MSNWVELASLGAVALVCIAAGVVILFRVRDNPVKREQRRRSLIAREGRLGDAFITEATEDHLYYTYELRGVQYEASQDITSLRGHLPGSPAQWIGMAHLKYLPSNPANSIIIAEEWSGLSQKG
ncbi:MAG: hypothetical protein K2X35_24105 [Bryobacteraceae bacterium]|nr:hypothetical protein [Bryobacteraceae bacterium]